MLPEFAMMVTVEVVEFEVLVLEPPQPLMPARTTPVISTQSPMELRAGSRRRKRSQTPALKARATAGAAGKRGCGAG
jgi:hypothetical protein